MLESRLSMPHKIPYNPEPIRSTLKEYLVDAGSLMRAVGAGIARKIKDKIMEDPKYYGASAFFLGAHAGDMATTLVGVSKYGIEIEWNTLVRAAYYAGGYPGMIVFGAVASVGGLWLITKMIKNEIPEENHYLIPLGMALGSFIRIFTNMSTIEHIPY